MHPIESNKFSDGELNNAMGSDFYQRDRGLKINKSQEKQFAEKSYHRRRRCRARRIKFCLVTQYEKTRQKFILRSECDASSSVVINSFLYDLATFVSSEGDFLLFRLCQIRFLHLFHSKPSIN